ncbi:copper chaperone PCu(A)C [Abyssibius alkaniclasticus]|uniref:copper chaperone PCu(A)C n=1 Tax=Abyssibius alkaniclasticus TaxID=2881234 RepID=UPI002363556D|nr:copper chaperone PCu(A)C [Abyssibius alkaniclasticus]UPH70108.1 copper chaperone PCu(A)C [Abyssibius alkaniclasticus]|tara:strand:+ start:1159 stop:1635 length:477 start_codon:yes stop_codon:yes gene_type:complete
MRPKAREIGVAALAVLFALAASAQTPPPTGDVRIENAWTHANSEIGGAAGVYFSLTNVGAKTIELIGARADFASIETLHKTDIDTKGVPRMSAVPELKVAPGATVQLQPDGLHVMLIDLELPLVEGETLSLRLKFEEGEDVLVAVSIRATDTAGLVTE